jgi:hypothetical protein
MTCPECAKLQDAYREATRAFTLTVGRLTAAKRTPDFQAALDNSTKAKRAMDEARIAYRKHKVEHGTD